MRSIALANQKRGSGRSAISVSLPVRVDRRTRHSRAVAEILPKPFGTRALGAVVRGNVKLVQAPSFAQPITLHAPRSRGTAEYRVLTADSLPKWRP